MANNGPKCGVQKTMSKHVSTWHLILPQHQLRTLQAGMSMQDEHNSGRPAMSLEFQKMLDAVVDMYSTRISIPALVTSAMTFQQPPKNYKIISA